MHKRLQKLSKFLLKFLLGMVITVVVLLISIHLSPVQSIITKKIATSLSSTTGGRFSIESIRFSIFGNIEVMGLEVDDPKLTRILSLGTISLHTDLIKLLKGRLILEDVNIESLSGRLVSTGEGLNIDYFIKAFQSDPAAMTDSEAGNFQLYVNGIDIKDLSFEYLSEPDSLDFQTELPLFHAENFLLSINPNKIYIESISIEDLGCNLLVSKDGSPGQVLTNSAPTIPALDFGTGFDFDIGHFELKNSNFSFHDGDRIKTYNFDPGHLDVSQIDISLDNLSINKDTLEATFNNISLRLPGFSVEKMKAGLMAVNTSAYIKDLHLSSGRSEMELNLIAGYDSWPGILIDLEQADFSLVVQGIFDPADLNYFYSDSISLMMPDWANLEIESSTKFASGSAEIESLRALTDNSSIFVKGMILGILDTRNIAWKNLEIQSKPGADFMNILLPLLGDPRIPDHIQMELISSGDPSKFSIDGLFNTSWGNLKTKGSLGFGREDFILDLDVDGHNIQLNDITELYWLGPSELSIHVKGLIGKSSDLRLEGLISSIEFIGKPVRDIGLISNLKNQTFSSSLSIKDPNYQSVIDSEVLFLDSLEISAQVLLDHFRIGKLFDQDSSLILTGNWIPKVNITKSELAGTLEGYGIEFETSEINYPLDTFQMNFHNSTTASSVKFATEGISGNYLANFDIKDASEVSQIFISNILDMSKDTLQSKDRTMQVEFVIDNPEPFKIIGIDISELSGISIKGSIDEGSHSMELFAESKHFYGFNTSLDTLLLNIKVYEDSLYSSLFINDLSYDSIQLGNLKYMLLGNKDTLFSNLLLTRDSSPLFGIQSDLRTEDGTLWIYPDSLVLFSKKYIVDNRNPIKINDNNVMFSQFEIVGDQSTILIDGNLDDFTLSIANGDLKRLNSLLSDTASIKKGYMNGIISYKKIEQYIDLKVNVDSLTLFEYPPVQLFGMASTNGFDVPFQFRMNSTSNNIDLAGQYSFKTSNVDAKLDMDVNDLKMFEIISPDFLDSISGSLKGNATLSGLIKEPRIDGSIRLLDLNLITSNPRTVIGIEDEVITLDNSGVYLQDFRIYDQNQNPLTINGFFKTENFQNFNYELLVNTEDYILINNPKKGDNLLQGLMIIGGDFEIKGNEKDTYVDANIIIRDKTDLDYVTPSEDIELITSEGIIQFVDASKPYDSLFIPQSQLYYDSLISILPKFEFNSNFAIEDNAILRFIIDPRSGDFIEASGNANLEIGLDKSGQINISGIYTINKGLYQLSFYDIVKKEFTISPGSTVSWNGDPYSGDINVVAQHIIKTSSVGLIGHEVGENEKALYRRPLPYEVGIIISGQLNRPEISFSLDLPKEEKTNFPALANKLSRLQQPEFESELNKQVFGLLVLGGFIPESSMADLDQSLIATTVISNSVNSILTSQLNRFTNKYIKGIDIDVGLQAYNDFSAGSSQTRTTMDFRVTKRMMDDRLSFEIGGGMDITTDQSGPNTGSDNFRSDVAIIYDLTESGNKQLKAFNNETYDIIYHEIRNTGVSLIFIKEFDKKE